MGKTENTNITPKELLEKIRLYENRIERTREDVERITEEIRVKEQELAGIIASGDFTGSKEIKAEIKQKQSDLEDTKHYLKIQEEGKGITGYEGYTPDLINYLDNLQADVKERIAAQEEEVQKAKAKYIDSLKSINALRHEAFENHNEVTSALKTLKSFTGRHVDIPRRVQLNNFHSKLFDDTRHSDGVRSGVLGLPDEFQLYYLYGVTNYGIDKLIRNKKLDSEGIYFDGDSIYDIFE